MIAIWGEYLLKGRGKGKGESPKDSLNQRNQ